jgi:hypothetical protein
VFRCGGTGYRMIRAPKTGSGLIRAVRANASWRMHKPIAIRRDLITEGVPIHTGKIN